MCQVDVTLRDKLLLFHMSSQFELKASRIKSNWDLKDILVININVAFWFHLLRPDSFAADVTQVIFQLLASYKNHSKQNTSKTLLESI